MMSMMVILIQSDLRIIPCHSRMPVMFIQMEPKEELWTMPDPGTLDSLYHTLPRRKKESRRRDSLKLVERLNECNHEQERED
jgi:hypothetical protein